MILMPMWMNGCTLIVSHSSCVTRAICGERRQTTTVMCWTQPYYSRTDRYCRGCRGRHIGRKVRGCHSSRLPHQDCCCGFAHFTVSHHVDTAARTNIMFAKPFQNAIFMKQVSTISRLNHLFALLCMDK
jgi:hypothetical protein